MKPSSRKTSTCITSMSRAQKAIVGLGWGLAVAVMVAYVGFRAWEEGDQVRRQTRLPEAVSFESLTEEPIVPVIEVVKPPSSTTTQAATPQTTVADVVAIAHPRAMNLAVPFTAQAPSGNWSLPYQEACEEASVLMAVAYFDSTRVDIATKEAATAELLALVDFQTERFGDYKDTTAEETARFARQRYEHITFDIVRDPTVEDLRAALARGQLVIVPAYGRALGNPHFSGDGPLYHMLVLRGYDADRGWFVTNDPGTRYGEGYVYDEATIMAAMGDWNDGDPQNGEKVVLVVSSRVR